MDKARRERIRSLSGFHTGPNEVVELIADLEAAELRTERAEKELRHINSLWDDKQKSLAAYEDRANAAEAKIAELKAKLEIYESADFQDAEEN